MPRQQEVTHRVARTEIEAALQRIQCGEAKAEDAGLLRALFDGFNSLVQVVGAEVELTSGTDRGGWPCFYLMMTYPEEPG